MRTLHAIACESIDTLRKILLPFSTGALASAVASIRLESFLEQLLGAPQLSLSFLRFRQGRWRAIGVDTPPGVQQESAWTHPRQPRRYGQPRVRSAERGADDL